MGRGRGRGFQERRRGVSGEGWGEKVVPGEGERGLGERKFRKIWRIKEPTHVQLGIILSGIQEGCCCLLSELCPGEYTGSKSHVSFR